jgi:polyisoprenoid-binding protein YceI
MRRYPSTARFVVRAGLACAAAACVFVSSPGVRAQGHDAEVFTFNPAATTVDFTLAATLHTVHGTMKLISGEIRFDQATGAASGTVVVDATSGQTGNASRDKRMHKEILQSGRYPQIVFTAQRLTGTILPEGPSQVELSGLFELEGRQHPMTLTLNITRQAGSDSIHATTKFAVPYVQWGVKSPNTFFLHVSDNVEMTIDASGQLSVAR